MGQQPAKLPADEARSLLRGISLRCTSCRVAVVQFLAGIAAPASHSDVAEALVPEGYDKSTIYRCLVELSEAGLVNRFDLGDHVWRFEMRLPPQHAAGDHPHFMCLDCGKVSCLKDVRVRIVPASGRPAAPLDVTEVLLKGHCQQCQ